ncbi:MULTISPECIES: hypothetical protein [unclassified Schaalia]|uniref:hypothetical protein n=1 Tax=unclassified Schaalia TaxID=2691889 RepID=UPI001E2B9F1E|nr:MULTISPECIES: hypothetical protein [unclassified Schaalia]MCD4549301.1 hypothetical protein [Schaalia sp. lx-260]MCD4557110.1 hypothetical protein [Schaalia sp. lx-100]
MSGFFVQMLAIPLLFFGFAGIMLAVMVLRRHSINEWHAILRRAFASLKHAPKISTDVETRRTSLASVWSTEAETGSAYLNATQIPGYEQLEQVADRLETTYRNVRRS